MYIIYIIIVVIWFLFGILFPTMKRKRCTEPVSTMVTNKRKAYVGKMWKTVGDITYFFNGKPYIINLVLRSEKVETMQLLINPEKPKEWVQANKAQYYGYMFLSFVLMILIIGAVYFVFH